MSGIIRKISRNILKKEHGNNKINQEWQRFMAFKYSEGELQKLRAKNRKKRR